MEKKLTPTLLAAVIYCKDSHLMALGKDFSGYGVNTLFIKGGNPSEEN